MTRNTLLLHGSDKVGQDYVKNHVSTLVPQRMYWAICYRYCSVYAIHKGLQACLGHKVSGIASMALVAITLALIMVSNLASRTP